MADVGVAQIAEKIGRRNMETSKVTTLPRWMWWTKGECVVEIIKTGHFPTSAMVKLPNDVVTEVEIEDLGRA